MRNPTALFCKFGSVCINLSARFDPTAHGLYRTNYSVKPLSSASHTSKHAHSQSFFILVRFNECFLKSPGPIFLLQGNWISSCHDVVLRGCQVIRAMLLLDIHLYNSGTVH